MDECPHCGEPIDENAESCPHCGSDFETGWNPDADYLGLELPEESGELRDEYPSNLSYLRWEKTLGLTLVGACAILFFWAGGAAYGSALVPFAILLGACGFFSYRRLAARKPA
jgi:hypothetical protein